MNRLLRRGILQLGWLSVVAPIILLIVGHMAWYKSTAETITITVHDKERVAYSESSEYLVFTNSEVFSCSDSYYFGKFNSADVYGRLQQGARYKVKVAGWRVPFLSMHRNIISAKRVQ